MVKRIGGNRRKTRAKFKKDIQDKGKISFTRYFQSFEDGEKVILKAETAVQKGLYFPRFHGKVGVVSNKRGNCYEILVNDHNKQKRVIVHPVHLMKR